LSLMAAIWAAGGLYFGHATAWAIALAVAIALTPILSLRSAFPENMTKQESRRVGRVVGLSSALEGVGIVVGAQVSGSMGRADLIVCVVSAIVGLHFFPLARWLPRHRYYLTGAAIFLVGISGGLVSWDYRTVFVASLTSVILWATALSLALDLHQKAGNRRSPHVPSA